MYIYLFCVPHGDGVCRRILHFQSPQAISLHLSPSDVDFTPGFYNPLTAWTHYTAHIINTAYNVFLLVILGSIKSALLIRIADTVCLLCETPLEFATVSPLHSSVVDTLASFLSFNLYHDIAVNQYIYVIKIA